MSLTVRCMPCLLQACKVPHCAKMARQAVQDGMAVVIGLQSTGEPASQPACLPASWWGQPASLPAGRWGQAPLPPCHLATWPTTHSCTATHPDTHP